MTIWVVKALSRMQNLFIRVRTFRMASPKIFPDSGRIFLVISSDIEPCRNTSLPLQMVHMCVSIFIHHCFHPNDVVETLESEHGFLLPLPGSGVYIGFVMKKMK